MKLLIYAANLIIFQLSTGYGTGKNSNDEGLILFPEIQYDRKEAVITLRLWFLSSA